MASVSHDPGGKKRITFKGLDGKRRALYLGKCGKGNAETIRRHVDAILTAAMSLGTLAADTADWLGKIHPDLHAKLVNVGLTTARESTGNKSAALLGSFIDGYLARREDLKPASRLVLGHVIRNLKEFFGTERPMELINPAEADDFRRWLEVTEELAPATIGKRIEWCDTFFRDALRRKLIPENPFIDVKRSKATNKDRQKHIDRAVIDKVIDACPNAEWRLLVALSRFLGLRVPSEPFSLKWTDIDWATSRMTITSVKTARYDGRGSRLVPILPEIRIYLNEVDELSQEGDVYVFENLRKRASVRSGYWADINLRTTFTKIIKSAGFVPWPKLWHNLRASAQTDLAAVHPLHVVCAWLGNSKEIAKDHYLLVTDSDFDRAMISSEQPAQITARGTRAGTVGSGRIESRNEETPVFQGASSSESGGGRI